MHYIILFLYCILLSFAYGYVFKKPFAHSIAPAFFMHILLCIFTAVVFRSVSLGIWGGVCVAIAVVLKAVWSEFFSDIKNKISGISNKNDDIKDISISGTKKSNKILNNSSLTPILKSYNSTAFLAFVFIFISIIFINMGKCFTEWDEFSHWGMFLKETLRLDRLYCTSPKDFPHKDYVPLVTMFISICSKLSIKFSEADAYRAVQLLQFSMILPIIQKGGTGAPVIINAAGKKKLNFTEIFKSLLVVLLVVITLLYILPMDGLNAFHTIYQDVIYAFFLFYCMYVAYTGSGNYKYDTFLLTLSLTMLVLVKMTAIFFLPFILGLYFVKNCMENKQIKLPANIIVTVISGVIPFFVWKLLNGYVQKFVDAGIQSYDNVKFGAIFDVLLHNGVISFQNQIDANLRRILSEQFFGTLSIKKIFVLLLVITFVFVLVFADKVKLLLLDLWILLTGAAYAFLIYFLYCTQFAEHEAIEIAGFPRYYISFIYAVILFLIYVGINTPINVFNFSKIKKEINQNNKKINNKIDNNINVAVLDNNENNVDKETKLSDSIKTKNLNLKNNIKDTWDLDTEDIDNKVNTENINKTSYKTPQNIATKIELILCKPAIATSIIFIITLALAAELFVTIPDRFTRLLPGYFTGDTEFYEARMKSAEPILANTNNDIDERVFCIISDSDYGRFFRLRYDTNPRTVDGGIIGSGRSDAAGWAWNWDLQPDELVTEVSKYEYIYFESVDDIFLNQYSEAFSNPAQIKNNALYKVTINNKKIDLIE